MTLFDEAPAATGPRRISLVKLSSEISQTTSTIGVVAVEGEVHQPRERGYIFFTLKDRAAQIGVYCPANKVLHCRVVNGERALVTGSLVWGAQRGDLQLHASEVVPVGAGAVAAMLAEVRARLVADGLVSRPRRALPLLPRAVGVVCGADAAVRHDIQAVVDRRFPGYPLVWREVRVSGAMAAEAMAGALTSLSAEGEVDVVILAHGGGDATELLPFSDEALCHAVAASTVPVVSAVGHEADRPLCDEVADLRCGTPSMAAAQVFPDRAELEAHCDRVLLGAAEALRRRVADAERRLAALDASALLIRRADRAQQRLDAARARVVSLRPRQRLEVASVRLAGIARQLDALSPVRVLERGYAVVWSEDGRALRSASEVASGALLDVQLADGRIAVTATGHGEG